MTYSCADALDLEVQSRWLLHVSIVRYVTLRCQVPSTRKCATFAGWRYRVAVERPIAMWIKQQRKARGWKVEELSRRLIEAGYDASVGTIRVWESPRGRDPHPRTLLAMERMFDTVAPREEEPDLVSAIEALTDAVAALPLSIALAIRADVPAEELRRLLSGASGGGGAPVSRRVPRARSQRG